MAGDRRGMTRRGKGSMGRLSPGCRGCDAGHLGETSRIPYTAVYTFYAPGPATDALGNPR